MNLTLNVRYQQKQATIQLPDEVPLYQLTPALAQKLNLPQQMEDGTVYLYYFVYQGKMLPNEQTFAQLQLPDKAEVLLEQTAVSPTLQQQTNIDPSLTHHLSLTRQEIWQQEQQERSESADALFTNRNYFLVAVIILMLFLVASFVATNQTTTGRVVISGVTPIPPTATTQATQNAPTATPEPPKLLLLDQYQLDSIYHDLVYMPDIDTLIGRPINSNFLYIYNMPTLRTGAPSDAIEYLVLTEIPVIQEMHLAPTDTNSLLISHTEGAMLLNITTRKQTLFTSIEQACEFVGALGNCIEANIVPDSQVCPTIWQGEGNYYLTRCGDIYWQPEDSSPILARSIPYVLDVAETKNGKLIILGKSSFAIYDAKTMQGKGYTIAENAEQEIHTQQLFLNESETHFYITYLPSLLDATEITTHWVLVGTLP